MTKEEAEKKLEEFNNGWFCPVIKGMCRKDCYFFVSPCISEGAYKKKEYLYHTGYCDFNNQ